MKREATKPRETVRSAPRASTPTMTMRTYEMMTERRLELMPMTVTATVFSSAKAPCMRTHSMAATGRTRL